MNPVAYSKIGKADDLENKKDRRIYRFFEIMPGLMAWATILLIIILSFFLPVYIAVFIIIFDVYWLVKTIYLSFNLRVAFSRLRQNMKVNWKEKLEELDISPSVPRSIKHWTDIYHLVIFPMYKESKETVSASFEGLVRANYPLSKMIVILAIEERAGNEARETANFIEQNYGHKFLRFLITVHPSDLAGEITGKGANASWAARQAKEKIIDPTGIPYSQVVVSNFDIDTVIFPEYFGRLTYVFLTTPDPLRSSYQPVPFYTNNIWEAPSFARVVAFSATFWHTIKQELSESATTFSSHSMPFKALVDIDFWQTNMVSEDSRVFWQCFLRYDGDYKITPLFYPVSMDANVAPTFWQTIKNVYKQQRRWGYGVENIPYFLFGFLKNKKISLGKKWFYSFRIIEGFHSWATNAIIIFLLGWLPVIVGGSEFNRTVLSYNLPFLTRIIMSMAMIGLISSAVLSIILLPPRPPHYGKFKYLWMVFQWIIFPATTIFLGAMPGLEAQTRLMLGKYMGFWVTPKHQSSSNKSSE